MGNLKVHLHIIALDGAYERKSTGRLKFIPASAPTDESTMRLVTDIALRINGHLRKKGYLEEVDGLPILGNTEEIFVSHRDKLHLPAQAASVAQRVAFGVHAGKPVRRLRLGVCLWPAEQKGEVRSAACVTAGVGRAPLLHDCGETAPASLFLRSLRRLRSIERVSG